MFEKDSLSAFDVAAAFVRLSQLEEQPMSHMQLQKLVFLAQSKYAHDTGSGIYREATQAWEHGPAVKPLFGVYKEMKKSPISRILLPMYHPVVDVPSYVQAEAIAEVWGLFSPLTAAELRRLTHQIGPWPTHYVPGGRDIELPLGEIADAWDEFLGAVQDEGPASGMDVGAVGESYRSYTEDDVADARAYLAARQRVA